MSSLQAQLASLNGSSGKNPGSILATSKRHEEALGRGVNWSIQHGHSVTPDQARFKASIIYENSREASDVPLYRLEENCKQAMEDLADVHPPMAKLSRKLCDTSEDASDKVIIDVISRLATLFGENSEPIEQNCLHVLEYMVRRYNIHSRFMEELVWAVLPQSDRLTAVFHRVLRLVDLASNQSYLWLRAYADPKRPSLACLPRDLISKHVMKNTDLLRQLCRLSSIAAKLHGEEAASDDSLTITNEARRGISYILSFSAAVLVGGLAWQSKQDVMPSVRESVIRVMLPTVLNACGGSSNTNYNAVYASAVEWTGWGYVIASAMAETMDLAPAAIEALTCRMLIRGVVDNKSLEERLDALAAVLSVLLPPNAQQKVSEQSFLPLLNSRWIGCDLPVRTYRALCDYESLPSLIGALHAEQGLVVAPIVAAIAVNAIRENDPSGMDCLEEMIGEGNLGSVWKDPRVELAASLAARVVKLAGAEDVSDDVASAAERVISGLFQLDPLACERGVATSIKSMSLESVKLTMPWLESILSTIPCQEIGDRTISMPPRVALEHADCLVRVQAAEKLLSQLVVHAEDDASKSSVFDSFLRRWSMDTDPQVALVVAGGLNEALRKAKLASFENRWIVSAQSALSGHYRWMASFLESDIANDGVALMKVSIELLANLVKCVVDSQAESTQELRQLMLEAIIAETCSEDESLKDHAQLYLGKALKSKKCRELLLGNASFLAHLIRDEPLGEFSGEAESRCQVSCFWIVLGWFQESLGAKGKKKETAKCAVGLLTAYLRHTNKPLESKKASNMETLLVTCLSHWPKDRDDVVSLLCELASVQSTKIFKSVCATATKALLQNYSDESAPLLAQEGVMQLLDHPSAVARIVDVLSALLASGVAGAPQDAVIVMLVLLDNENKDVRSAGTRLLTELATCSWKNNSHACLKELCVELYAIRQRVNQTLGYEDLPAMLRNMLSTTKTLKSCRESLLILCANVATGNGSLHRYAAVARAMLALEKAGEDAFPLSLRWKLAGQPILDHLLLPESQTEHQVSSVFDLAKSVTSMLKGYGSQGQGVILSAGPLLGGGRARTYSMDKVNESPDLQAYSEAMLSYVTLIFSECDDSGFKGGLANLLGDELLSTPEWGSSVFRKLPKGEREKVSLSIIAYASSEASGYREKGPLSLPFDGDDTIFLLKSSLDEKTFSLGSLSVATNFVKLHTDLMNSKSMELTDILFSHLRRSLAGDIESRDFTLQLVLPCLVKLLKWTDDDITEMAPKRIQVWAETLLDICVERIPFRLRSDCVVLVTRLSSRFPKIMSRYISRMLAFSVGLRVNETAMTIAILVPEIYRLVNEELSSFVDLCGIFVGKCGEIEDNEQLKAIISVFVESIPTPRDDSDLRTSLGGTVLVALAVRDQDAGQKSFYGEIFGHTPLSVKLNCLLTIVDYAGEFADAVFSATWEAQQNPPSAGYPNARQLVSLGNGVGKVSMDRLLSAGKMLIDLLSTIASSFDTGEVAKSTSSGDGRLLLRLWQRLLVIQTNVKSIRGEENSGVLQDESSTFSSKLGGCVEELQAVIPGHVFLASTASLLKEGTDDIRSEALRLLAERAASSLDDSYEVSLFVDTIPSVVDAIGIAKGETQEAMGVQHAAIFALTQLCRRLSTEGGQVESLTFLPALEKLSHLLKDSTQNETVFAPAEQELVTSILLSQATLIQCLGRKSIPFLPALMKSVEVSLKVSNEGLDVSPPGTFERKRLRLLQVAILRVLISVVDSVPQFISPFIANLLTPSALLSSHLRAHDPSDESSLVAIVQYFDQKLSAKIPPRVLISVASNCLENIKTQEATAAILRILTMSVECASPPEVLAQKRLILRAVETAFELDLPYDEDVVIVHQSSDLFLSATLKLSEVQLRRMFHEVQAWRGPLDATNPENGVRKRFAFWTIASKLSEKLRSIFLPCLTMCVDDVVGELQIAADELKSQSFSKDGPKRRRLSDSSTSKNQSLRLIATTKTVLCVLENALRADAHEGGKWIRGDEGRRFEAIVNPLGSLLHCNLPKSQTDSQSLSESFESFVCDSSGSIIACFSALASATGNEQQWKPINHALLDACGSESRPEVRTAGLQCMLTLMSELGEEYMVLLPECLPVLSELLEDHNEEVSALARDVVDRAEELIGESLEDSLR